MIVWTEQQEDVLNQMHNGTVGAVLAFELGHSNRKVRVKVYRQRDSLYYTATDEDLGIVIAKGEYELLDWGEDRVVYRRNVKIMIGALLLYCMCGLK